MGCDESAIASDGDGIDFVLDDGTGARGGRGGNGACDECFGNDDAWGGLGVLVGCDEMVDDLIDDGSASACDGYGGLVYDESTIARDGDGVVGALDGGSGAGDDGSGAADDGVSAVDALGGLGILDGCVEMIMV